MRLQDIPDYFRLKKFIERPAEFLRLRKRKSSEDLKEVRFHEGFSVFLRPATFDRQFFHRIFARDEYRLAPLQQERCECIVDIGGQIGLFAIRASMVADRVLTFEPMPESYALLEKNLSSDRFAHVRHVQAAVTDHNGTGTLHRSHLTGHNTMYVKLDAGAADGTEEVQTLSLEQVFQDHQVERCDLLKLDCEGAEYPILYAAPDEVLSRIRRIHMEYHGVEGGDPLWNGAALRDHLESKGYRVDFLPAARPPGGRVEPLQHLPDRRPAAGTHRGGWRELPGRRQGRGGRTAGSRRPVRLRDRTGGAGPRHPPARPGGPSAGAPRPRRRP